MDQYRKLLAQFVSLKSISTDPAFQDDINQTAKWLHDLFIENGFQAELISGYENPVVFAHYEANPSYESVLVYGHYDVQPATIEDGWDSEPFDLTERAGKLYGRGVVDNKGQILAHMSSIFELIKDGKLKYNVKFLIEGNEETGGSGVGRLLKERAHDFKVDHVMISDGELPYRPVVTASFRGTFNVTVRYRSAAQNLHSGLYGGAVPNAAEELSKLIAALYDEDNNSTIEGFYDGLDSVTEKDLANCKVMDEEKLKAIEHADTKKLYKGKYSSFTANLGFNSMYTVSGLKSGYTDDGYSNIVPNLAEARFNFRIAASQDPEAIFKMFEKFVRDHTPKYIEVEFINLTEMTKPVRVDLYSAKHLEVFKLLEDVYGEKVLVDFCGATIPVVVDFKEGTGVDPLLVSLGNDDCNMHGPNENFDIGLIDKALRFCDKFYSKVQ